MRLLIAAVGKIKDAEERGICQRYALRLATTGKSVGLGPLDTIELSESRAESADARKADEAHRLVKATSAATFRIALDENGKQLSSEDFARLLAEQAATSTKSCAFLLGGPDGHGRDVLATADRVLSLGLLTYPHGFARALLTEQLYRAATILAGHPYHRS
jgi:23S rRNA (pseudouridine1915-N3)-methyltransferase